MPVSMFVADNVAGVDGGASLLDVADMLVAEDVGALAVRQGERVVGVISERDLVHALATRRDTAATRAIDVATTELAWCDNEATVAEVAVEMAERYVRHVLVEDEGRVVGIVSARDLLGAYAAADADFD
jgi:CBS domain-containing protein